MIQRKLLLILIGIVATLGLLLLLFYSRINPSIRKASAVRPENFPEILVAPESAEKVRYGTPPYTAPRIYIIRFRVTGRYLVEDAWSFIENHLKSHGWHRLNRYLQNPQFKQLIPYGTWYRIKVPTGEQTWQLMEDWLNDSGEYIRATWSLSPEKEFLEADSMYVSLSFFERNSWKRPYVLRYKELYPEEFDTSTDTNKPTEQ